ncbi:DHHW family protein [Mesobacillus sp. AQ2]|uniref:DHHW family protein n=1 Tax=Mesobacillus sp. AQ2 TaxID=3043332 RepID=UPI0024C1FDE5|nr:DHHW family protein [Mesobacillus sp. AQ2]WHX43043.1 DHHW family protein [Mesobacillus sp. AQ2]
MRIIETTLLPVLFILFLFLIGGYLYLSPDQEVSFVEYRSLQQKPEMTLKGIANGEFVKQYEDYFTDQFPGRNLWLKTYLKLQQLSGKTFLNGYYIAEDGTILPEPLKRFNEKEIKQASVNLNKFAGYASSKGAEVYFFGLPHKTTNVVVKMPSFVEIGKNKEKKDYFYSNLSANNMKIVDISEKFKNKYTQEEINDLYFKTDHHWNAEGAYSGYQIIKETLKHSSVYTDIENKYELKCSNKKFEGSYNRQVYDIVDLRVDKPCIKVPVDNKYSEYKVYVNGKKSAYDKVYAAGIEKNSKLIYGHVFTDDIRKINISNPKVEKGNVLIVKDSYGSPITFDIAQHFRKSTVVDIRYNKKQSLKDILDLDTFDAVIFLYNDGILQGELYEFDKAPL